MQLIPTLNTDPTEDKGAGDVTTASDDVLGMMLQKKWTNWSTTRRRIEERWLEDLRTFSQQNEPGEELSKFHGHIYIGQNRVKCNSAYARIVDLLFATNDEHWSIKPVPVTSRDESNPANFAAIEADKQVSEAMTVEVEAQMKDLKYDDYIKQALHEGSIIGTGCVKGIIPTTRFDESWQKTVGIDGTTTWELVKTEYPAPEMGAPSVFNVYPDPYATRKEDMSGVFERHSLNRQQFVDLKNDKRFDSTKIDEILRESSLGNHTALWHESIRRTIAEITDTTANMAEQYDLLEYWGQATGLVLQQAGMSQADEIGVYWVNVWTCASKTLLCKIMPMKRQVIPYNFFIYEKVPHQFWGVSPARTGRSSQLIINGAWRSTLDGMAMASGPMSEVNVSMLREGQDPTKLRPWQTFVRDKGDPSYPAVRWFQPEIPVAALMNILEAAKTTSDEETSMPAYSYGSDSPGINDNTASGTAMHLNQASLPIKLVVRNVEDGCITPVVQSLVDWNMQWSDKEEIKGNHKVTVNGGSTMIMKEQQVQQKIHFLAMTANPIDAAFVDRKYLLRETAKDMDIDATLAVPDQLPQFDLPPPHPNPVEEAKAGLLQAQAKLAEANTRLADANVANKNINTQFESVMTGGQILANPGTVAVSDSLLQSAGYVDANGAPVANVPLGARQMPVPAQVQGVPMPQNTHPNMPALPPQPGSPGIGAREGIEGGGIQARATGGPVEAGKPYLVGEQ
jgi:hypothetical protein